MQKTKIYLDSGIDVVDFASGLCSANTYEDLIKLIREIDAQQQDWQFTYKLKDLVDELMEEEADKINGD